jgi:hypothetical protein
MLRYSSQLRIIKSYFYSFKNHKQTNMPVSDSELQRYKSVYNPSKYETFTETDFRVFVLWSLFQNRFSSLQSVLSHLNNLDKKEIQKIRQVNDTLIGYQSIFEKDKEKAQMFDKKIPIIISLYKNNEISFLFLYHFMYHNQDQIQGRIQSRLFKDLSLFLSFFSKIKKYLEG